MSVVAINVGSSYFCFSRDSSTHFPQSAGTKTLKHAKGWTVNQRGYQNPAAISPAKDCKNSSVFPCFMQWTSHQGPCYSPFRSSAWILFFYLRCNFIQFRKSSTRVIRSSPAISIASNLSSQLLRWEVYFCMRFYWFAAPWYESQWQTIIWLLHVCRLI